MFYAVYDLDEEKNCKYRLYFRDLDSAKDYIKKQCVKYDLTEDFFILQGLEFYDA